MVVEGGNLYVAVNDVVLMAPLDRLAQLVDQAPHKLAVEASGLLLKDFQEVLFHVLEHEVSAGR